MIIVKATTRILLVVYFSVVLLATAHAEQTTRKIVLFHEGVPAIKINLLINLLNVTGVSTVMRLPAINGVILEVPNRLLNTLDLNADSIIMSVEDDQPLTIPTLIATEKDTESDTSNEPASFVEQFNSAPDTRNVPWGILNIFNHPYDPSLYMSNFNEAWISSWITQIRDSSFGERIKVAIIDTGINSQHSELLGLVKGGIDLTKFKPGIPLDDNGHGTHVAAILAGQISGIANKSKLYAVKILDRNAEGNVSTLLMALQWAIDNDIDVVNMSVAFRDDNLAVNLAVRKAYAKGIIMVAAVGNHSNWLDEGGSAEGGSAEGGSAEGGSAEGGSAEGGSAEGGSAEGGSAEGGSAEGGSAAGSGNASRYSVMYPAVYPEVIAVGAIDPYYRVAWFSNVGPETDVLAPGVDIVSAILGNFYGVASGTSMAAPHVSGVVALMLTLAIIENKDLMPADVQRILWETAPDGVINLNSALNEVMLLPKRR